MRLVGQRESEREREKTFIGGHYSQMNFTHSSHTQQFELFDLFGHSTYSLIKLKSAEFTH